MPKTLLSFLKNLAGFFSCHKHFNPTLFFDTAVLISVIALGMSVSCFQMLNSDIFWHLTTGRMMANGQTGRAFFPPYFDPFSFTALPPGRVWIDLHWLFQWAAYGVWCLGGVPGLILAKMGLVIAWIALLYRLFRTSIPIGHWALGAALALMASHPRLMVRPEMFSFTYGIFLVLLCDYFFRAPTRLLFFTILLIQVLWVNSQGLFVIGLLIIGAFCFFEWVLPGRKNKRWALALGFAALAACLVNPYGIKGLLFPITLYTRIDAKALNIYASQIGEFFPTFDRVALIEPSHLYFFVIYATLFFFIQIVATVRKKSRPEYWLIGLCLFYLGLRANRNSALFSLVTLPIFCLTLQRLCSTGFKRRWMALLTGTLTVLFCFMWIPRLTSNQMAIAELSGRRSGFALRQTEYPIRAVELIKRYQLKGHYFAEYQHFGYLLWEVPGTKISFDGRLEVYSESDFRQYLFFLTGAWADRSTNQTLAFARFNDALARLGHPTPLTGILLNIESQTLPISVTNMLKNSADWALVSLDLNAALFLNRHMPINDKAISENEIDIKKPLHFPPPLSSDVDDQRDLLESHRLNRFFFALFPDPLPYPEKTLRYGQFLFNLGHVEESKPYLSAAFTQQMPFADVYLAQSLVDDTLEKKLATLEKGILHFPNDTQLRQRKGRLLELFNPPRLDEAYASYETALDIDGRYFPSIISQSRILHQRQNYELRFKLLKRAFKKRLRHPEILFALNEEYVRRGDHQKALDVLKEANLIFHGDEPMVWFRLAFSQFKLNQPDKARASLAKAKATNSVFFAGQTHALRPELAEKIQRLENQ